VGTAQARLAHRADCDLGKLRRLACKRNFDAHVRQINPTAAPGVALAKPGQITSDIQKWCQASETKKFRFSPEPTRFTS
jgi:hypothetical protein